jgi:isopenicillin N synthase-like dioxygenase
VDADITLTSRIDEFVNEGWIVAEVCSRVRSLIDVSFSAGLDFFERPIAEKAQDRLPRDTGYRPFEAEYSSSPEQPDQVESFTVSRRIPESVRPVTPWGTRLYGSMLNLFDALIPIIENFTIEIASKFVREPLDTQLRGSFLEWSLLQLNHSRPANVHSPFINEAHEDGCLMTAMVATVPGLEIQRKNGSFTPVVPIFDRVVLASGEILWLLSGGAVHPTYHRVTPHPEYDRRMSLLLFADINPSKCKPWIVNELNRGVDIGAKVLKNSTRFGLAEWNAN